jgi:hypothetical protein
MVVAIGITHVGPNVGIENREQNALVTRLDINRSGRSVI